MGCGLNEGQMVCGINDRFGVWQIVSVTVFVTLAFGKFKDENANVTVFIH